MVKNIKRAAGLLLTAVVLLTMPLSVSASDSYKNWIQSDARWGRKCLGVSDETMSQVGCAVTSAAMLAVHSGSVSENGFDPGVLCDYLSENGGFDSYANIYWSAVSGLVPSFTFCKSAGIKGASRSEVTSEIAGFINQGYYMVLSVNYDCHWVAVDTVSDGEVYIMDPAQNSEKRLFSVYDAAGVSQVKLYKGKRTPAKVSTEASGGLAVGHYKTTSALNFRRSPDTSSDVIKVIPKGTTVSVKSVVNGWGRTEYSGKEGWICLDYAEYIESTCTYRSGNYTVNANGGVNLRSSAGTDGSRVCLIPNGETVRITYVTNGWGRAYYGSKSGFICMDYLKYAGNAVTTATTAVPAKTTTTTTTTTATTTAATTAKPITTSSGSNVPKIVGDLNGSGTLTKTDLILLNEYIADPTAVSASMKRIMDVNADGNIDARDSVYLLKLITRSSK